MKSIQPKDLGLFGIQIVVIMFILVSPGLISFLTISSPSVVWQSLFISGYWLAPAIGVYLINFYLLVPWFYLRHRYLLFVAANVVLVLFGNAHIFLNDASSLPDYYRAGYSSFVIIALMLSGMAVVMSISLRRMLHRSEQKQKEVEAELALLKNQIHPHFLFNTLNNISSLTQIDADEAQDAVMQLSDLLRYAMYETNKPMVPISGEIDFLRNYINLMQLRCNEQTTVSSYFHADDPYCPVAPLLFISLVENAFKHGVNSSEPATVSISLVQQGDTIVFTSDNSNNPRPTTDRSGSGIGLENTRRRLQLLYPGLHLWEQTVTPEGMYHVRIELKNRTLGKASTNRNNKKVKQA